MRVTADTDQSELLALMAFYNMTARYAAEPQMWRTGFGGVHFVNRDLPLTWEEAAQERALFRDDENRINLDLECSMKPFQTLFSKKQVDRGYRSKLRWKLDARGLLAMPCWASRMPPKRLEKRRRRARERRARIAVTWPKPK